MKIVYYIIIGISIIMLLLSMTAQLTFAYDPQEDKAPYYLSVDELDKTLGVKPETEKPNDYVCILYFHRVPGCSTCQLMSKYVYDTILKNYPEQVKKRQIILRYYDFEDKKNEKLVQTFNITSPTLVLIQGRSGKDVKAKYADKIWSLAGDKKAFMKYIVMEIDGYLK